MFSQDRMPHRLSGTREGRDHKTSIYWHHIRNSMLDKLTKFFHMVLLFNSFTFTRFTRVISVDRTGSDTSSLIEKGVVLTS